MLQKSAKRREMHTMHALTLTLTLFGAGALSSGAGLAAPPPLVGREQVNGTLWMQHATEYRVSAEQVYRLATERLGSAVAAPGTAALEQLDADAETLATLPTAIVVDLDETVLDNSFYQARRALAGGEYDEASWQAWMSEASAPVIPGARDFLLAAAEAGHRIFYVTNRQCLPSSSTPNDPCPAKTWTQRNLIALDLPNAGDSGALILRGERPEWRASDKSVRRAWLAERYRIVALVGDDLRDFVDRATYADRKSQLQGYFGSRWFLLPNPLYGSWERAIVDGACNSSMTPSECSAASTARRYETLDPTP